MSQPSWIGRTLSGRYRIDALLGQGGMSAVYKATDPNLKRVVAIKLIHSHLSGDTQFIKRFEEEATAVASLRHPNIVQVFDFNADEGTYYMVLEFLPGETLQDRLKRLNDDKRLLSIKESIQYTVNICDALGYAHQRGMVHRDIKPANIMLDIHNQAILMDFGIVKIVGGDSHTATGAVVGTARYISPEVIRAEVPDERADIYSLGVTLYEMLSGRTPFIADSAMTLMMMHLNDPVPDPRSLRADVPQALVDVLLKAMAKDRNDRFRNAAEFAAALKGVLYALETGTAYAPIPAPAAEKIISAPTPAPVGNQPTQYEIPRPALPPSQPNYTVPASAQYTPPQPATAPKKEARPKLWIFGIAVAVFLCAAVVVGGGAVMLSGQFFSNSTPTQDMDALSTAAMQTVESGLTQFPAANAQQTLEAGQTLIPAEPTATIAPPTDTPTLAPTATPTYPPLYVRINSITINASNQYVVEYETFGYTEKLPGQHVHFFFNTVPPEQAGMPGSGPWIVYGGPRPFTKYTVGNRPANATQMCALVANPNHSVIAESGNCVDLP
jgi:serine/threonine protein kinase